MAKKSYHHGNLKAALLTAAEAELRAGGVAGFSLRAVAKRAGVSHAAPAHHFGDVDGVFTALAAESFRRFRAAMLRELEGVGDDPVDRLVAAGQGYITYCAENPALFELQFFSTRIHRDDPDLCEAGAQAYGLIEDLVRATDPDRAPDALAEAVAMMWAQAHGLAALFADGPEAEHAGATDAARKAAFSRIMRRVASTL